MAVIGQLSPNDEDFKHYHISISELAALTGIHKNNLYQDLDAACTRLMSSVIRIKEPDNSKGFLLVTWFSHARYNPEKGWIEFSISPELKPYLLKVKSQFTTYHFAQIAALHSTYSIRLYELLRQFLPLKSVDMGRTSAFRDISLKDLREYIGVESHRYPRFTDLRRNILEKVRGELKELTDIAFDFEPVRVGRKIHSIRFIIRHNPTFEAVADDVIEGSLDNSTVELDSNPLVDMMRIHFEGITDDELFLITNTYSDAVIKESLIAWMQAKLEGKINRDVKSYFLGVLANKRREAEQAKQKTTEARVTDRSWADELGN